jgi:hypothetical protein
MTIPDVVASSLMLGAVLLVLLVRHVSRQLASRFVRDEARAALIAQHPLLVMKKRGAR